MPIKYLLFDLDNTLLDFSKASRIALEFAFDELDIAHSEDNYQSYREVNHQVWSDYENDKLEIAHLPRHRSQLFMKKIGQSGRHASRFNDVYLTRLSEENHYLPEVENTLKMLQNDGYHMSIVTNGLSRVQRSRWRLTNLSSYFEDIYIAEEVGKPKPHSYYFNFVHGKIGRPNRQQVMIVGDNPVSDIDGGRDFGYVTCWFDRGVIESKTVKADEVITRMDQLTERLR